MILALLLAAQFVPSPAARSTVRALPPGCIMSSADDEPICSRLPTRPPPMPIVPVVQHGVPGINKHESPWLMNEMGVRRALSADRTAVLVKPLDDSAIRKRIDAEVTGYGRNAKVGIARDRIAPR